MADVTLFHNPNCSTSRHALDEAGAAGGIAGALIGGTAVAIESRRAFSCRTGPR